MSKCHHAMLKRVYSFVSNFLADHLTELMQDEKQQLHDIAPSIYNKDWQVDGVNDDVSMVNLDDPKWEDLDHSNAGGEYEAFHDLSEEMYTVTGRDASQCALFGSLSLKHVAEITSTIIHATTTCNISMRHGRINIRPL